MKERYSKFDNIRFILIILVVFGHLLELIWTPISGRLYNIIYSFHMPAFIFLTGYFARFKPKKILFSYIYVYIMFQTLYLIFAYYVLGEGETLALQYTTPYWLLWYMLATIFYYIIIPFLEWDFPYYKVVVFVVSYIISLLAGFDKSVGYGMTLSRFYTFLPFFVLGYYCKNWETFNQLCFMKMNKKLALMPVFAIVILLSVNYVSGDSTIITSNMLYGSFGYQAAGHTWKIKLILQLIGLLYILGLVVYVPNCKLPIITTIGTNTLPIFLFHGFIIRYIRLDPSVLGVNLGNGNELLTILAFTVVIVFALGNRYVSKICKWVFTGYWLELLVDRFSVSPNRTSESIQSSNR